MVICLTEQNPFKDGRFFFPLKANFTEIANPGEKC